MRLSDEEWTIHHLRQHLQYAVNLELWTIPFYMSAMYSIVDRSSAEFQLVQSVVNQEMLHVQLASNLANAYGYSPRFKAPEYEGQAIPHLDFNLDRPNPTEIFTPYSAEIGPLDEERINAMCLIEYPEWKTHGRPDLHDNVKEYGSIAEFYAAVEYGAGLLKSDLRGGVRQVDYFSAFYRNLPMLTVADSGEAGFRQALLLIDTICDQGEGASRRDSGLPTPFQNTADDSNPGLPHYEKFLQIRNETQRSPLYAVKPKDRYTEEDRALAAILRKSFQEFLGALEELFSGRNPEDFFRLMITVGAAIQNCWKHGVTPRFS